jgi:integrase
MATIRLRGPFQWQAIVKRKGYANQVRTFNTRRDADRWARGVEAELDRGVFVSRREAEETSLAEAIERYRMEVTPSKKGAQQENYRLNILAASSLSKRSLASIRSSDVAKYRDTRRKARSANTVRLELSALSSIFEEARLEWGMEGLHNPVRDVRKPPPGAPRERRFASPEEEKRLLDALKDYGDGWAFPLVSLALETGMRRGEWPNLHWKDVDLKRQTVVLHDGETKNGEGRIVPLSSKAVGILRTLPRSSSDRVFHVMPRTITAAFTRSRDRARAKYLEDCKKARREPDPTFLVDLHLHDMRHEATSRLFEEKELDVMEVASITGHKTLTMLKRYTHLKAEKLAKKLG